MKCSEAILDVAPAVAWNVFFVHGAVVCVCFCSGVVVLVVVVLWWW